ncbi:MAG: M64 family metallopeptidase [Bacteriovoracia bacterium]
MKNTSIKFTLLVSVLVSLSCNKLGYAEKPMKQTCIPLEYENKQRADHLNLIFLPSGYGDDFNKFRSDVENLVKAMNRYPIMGKGFSKRNVFLVEKQDSPPVLCNLIGDRSLSCDLWSVKKLARECGASVFHTIVLHNIPLYAGSGYISEDVAAITMNYMANDMIVHELGHSLFNLNDEYSYSEFSDTFPNCEQKGCGLWADLIDAKIEGVSCTVGYCKDGQSYASNNTFMKELGLPVFPANERFACCEYKNLTNEYPEFCSPFKDIGIGLEAYCEENFKKSQVWFNWPVILEFKKNGKKWVLESETEINRSRYFDKKVASHSKDIESLVQQRKNSSVSEIFEEDRKIQRKAIREDRNYLRVVVEKDSQHLDQIRKFYR